MALFESVRDNLLRCDNWRRVIAAETFRVQERGLPVRAETLQRFGRDAEMIAEHVVGHLVIRRNTRNDTVHRPNSADLLGFELIIQPGKPTQNAFVESFNGKLRDECLNVHWFDDLTDAKQKTQAWQDDYNESRPHRSLNDLSPLQYKARWAERRSENH